MIFRVPTSSISAGQVALDTSGSLEWNPPSGPATERRLPGIDPELGIVVGVTLLDYAEDPNQVGTSVAEG
jgi:hypothetical protein